MTNQLKKLQSIQNFCSKYGLLIVSILVFIIGLTSFFVTAYFDGDFIINTEKTSYKLDNIIQNIIFLILGIAIINLSYKILKNKNIKYILITIVILVFIIQILWVINIKFRAQSDQGYIVECAKSFIRGDISAMIEGKGEYLRQFPYQYGISLYIAIIFKILNTDKVIYLQILNTIFSTISIFYMFKITKLLFNNEKIEKISLILLLGFSLYFMFFDVHVYGNIIGLTFILIAIYYTINYIENHKWINIFIISIATGISIILKSNYNIFLCGIVIIILLDILKNKSIRNIIGIFIILISYILMNSGLKYTIEKLYKTKFYEGVPMISYIYMGIAEQAGLSSGWYTGDVLNIYYNNDYDYTKSKEESINLLKDRIKYMHDNPKYMLKYFGDKVASTWLNPTFQTVWCSWPGMQTLVTDQNYEKYLNNKKIVLSMLSGEIYDIEEKYFNTYQIMIFIAAAIGMFNLSKKMELKYLLLPIIFLGGFVFHLMWETKSIYVLQYYFLLIPYASYGLSNILQLNNIKKIK